MDARRAGFALLAAGALALVALLVLSPLPVRAYDAEGARGPVAVGAARLAHYDAANDTTLAVFGQCDHQPCGDAFVFRGDRRAALAEGRHLLVPEGGARFARELSDVDLNTRTGTPFPYGDASRAAGASTLAPRAELRSVWPPAIAYAAALGAAGAGAALAAGARWPALAPGAAAGAGLAMAPAGLLFFLSCFVVVPVGLAVAALLGWRRMPHSVAAALAVAAYVAVGILAGGYFPPVGSEV